MKIYEIPELYRQMLDEQKERVDEDGVIIEPNLEKIDEFKAEAKDEILYRLEYAKELEAEADQVRAFAGKLYKKAQSLDNYVKYLRDSCVIPMQTLGLSKLKNPYISANLRPIKKVIYRPMISDSEYLKVQEANPDFVHTDYKLNRTEITKKIKDSGYEIPDYLKPICEVEETLSLTVR